MKTYRIVSLSESGGTCISHINTELPLEKLQAAMSYKNTWLIEEGSELQKAVEEIKSHGTFVYIGNMI